MPTPLSSTPSFLLRRRRLMWQGQSRQDAATIERWWPVLSGTDLVGFSPSDTGDNLVMSGTDIIGVGAAGTHVAKVETGAAMADTWFGTEAE